MHNPHNARNPLRDTWLNGPDADPDPAAAEAVALITEYQLGLLSDIERKSLEHRLATDAPFACLAAPMLFAAHAMRWDAEAERRRDGEADRVAKIMAQWEVEKGAARKTGAQRARPPHRSPWHWQIAAGFLMTLGVTVGGTKAYAAILQSRIPPVSVQFTNAPLSEVLAALRRRYHIDAQVCDAGFQQDRVTLTITDAPIDSVADEIARQTLRFANWKVPYTGGPYTVLFQPQPDWPKGWWFNLRRFARSLTWAGCHR